MKPGADDNGTTPEAVSQQTVMADSIWLQGHFPGDPLLPGVAQIDLVQETISAALGVPCMLRRLKRIRFRHMIRPGDRVTVKAWPDSRRPATYQFQIMVADTVACTGTVIIDTAGSGGRTAAS